MEWEDLTVFFRSENGRMAVVGGAGMYLLQLAALRPETLSVVHNRAGLALNELRWVSARQLECSGMHTLFGHNQAGRRVFLYHQLKSSLSTQNRRYWDQSEAQIREGIWKKELGVYSHIRKRIIPIVHRAQAADYVNLTTISEQLAVFDRHWKLRRAELIMRLFPSHYRGWLKTIPQRFALGLYSEQPMLQWLLGDDAVGPYPSRALKRLKRKATRIDFVEAVSGVPSADQCWVFSYTDLGWTTLDLWRELDRQERDTEVMVINGSTHINSAAQFGWVGQLLQTNSPADILDVWRFTRET